MILSRRLKLLLLLLALLSGFSGFQLALKSLEPENALRKDFIADYLPAKAALAGMNPYQPLPDLDKHFQTGARLVFLHPTSHTPGLAIFSLPLAFFSYAQAARIWLLAAILCLSASVFLLLRGFSVSVSPLITLLVAWAALGWCHVWEDLILGQINIFLLLLITGAWLNLRSGRQKMGGALLGAAISFKLIFWPLALLLIFCRRWLSAIMAFAVFAAINLIAAVAMGWRVVASYYIDVGPSTAALYRACAQNLSLWSVGWRTFLGTGSPALMGVVAPPVFFSSRLAVITSLLLTGAALALGLAASIKANRNGKTDEAMNFDFAYGIMICVCLLISPLTWPHYLILMPLPAAVVMQKLRSLRFPRLETLLYAIAIVLLLIPDVSLQTFIFSFSTVPNVLSAEPGVQPDAPVSFAAALLSLIPTLSVLILFWLMRQLSRLPGAAPSKSE